ncbi:MAG: tetratricopeptide repeat protein, partial [Clostridia bacterium]|nr:tetratricopeptide repeat protein [Clostridia bacterium]
MSIQIEKTAVGWLNLAISRTELLDAIIDSNDKTPIWDGDIYVYTKPGRKNEDLIRRVPVQVKGSITSNTNAQKVFHSIPVSNLKHYSNEGGVLFIKVCFEKDGDNAAYYCGALLKGDIENILSKTPGAVKRKTVYLNRYSFEKDSLEKLLTGFALALNRVSGAPGLCWSEVEEELGRGVLAADPLPDVIRPLDIYKYDSGAVRFVGREKEMEDIERFLLSPRPFAWWGIAAPGGAGKSRLAYELKKKLDAEGIWKTELVKDNLIIELPAYSAKRLNEEYPGPTLFIIDYAQQYAETIANWMTRITADDFGRDWDNRLRFLLLDRANGEKETDTPAWEEQIIKNGANDRLYSQRYRPVLLLPSIEDELLVQIMRDFAVRLSENEETADEFTEEKARERVEALGRKEEGLLKRPLFAMMMTDLWLHNGGDADDWTMEDLLEGPIRRELRILNDRLSPYGGDGLKEACRGVLRMATVCSCKGDISLERLSELCPESMKEISNAENCAGLEKGELMLRAGLCDYECETAVGMTPDLFGEYLVFHWLCNKDQERQHSKKVAGFYSAALEEMPSAVEFFKRLLKDFGQMMAEDDGLRRRVFPEDPGLDDRKTQLYARLLRRLFDEPNDRPVREAPKKTLVALADGRQGNTEENSVIWNDAGSVCRDLGEHERALGFLLKDVKASEESRGANDPETASAYNNIASLYQDMGDYDKALEFNLKALAIRENAQELGAEHPDTAVTYNNIAGVYQDMGDYDKALEYLNMALETVKKVLGEEHPHTAATYNNIASLYKAMGDYDKALEYYNKALGVVKKILGEEHPHTAITYNNIAQVYQVMGDYDKALE